MSENIIGLTVATDKGLDDLQCQRLLSENRRYQEVMLQYCEPNRSLPRTWTWPVDCYQTEFVNANLKAVCSLHAFYPTACVSTHAVVLCDWNGRQMPFSPAPTSSSVPLGLIRRG